MRTVWDRVEWLRQRTRVEGEILSARAFSVWLGLSPGWMAAIKTRVKNNPEHSLEAESANKIAERTGANYRWLLTGEGAALDGQIAQADRYPERDEALLEFPALPQPVVDAVRAMRMHSGTKRPSKDEWAKRVELMLIRHARGEPMGRALEREDDRPPAGKGKGSK